MDVQYGIAVANKYALFIDEDEDPLEMLKQKEEESKNAGPSKKDKKKSAKKMISTDNKPIQQEQSVKREDASRLNGRGGRGGRGGRELRENDGSRPPRRQGPRENRDYKGDENVPPEFRDRGDAGNRRDRDGNVRSFDRGARGVRGGRGRGGRGGPRPEGGRGNFGGPMGERRQFDRHSGTDKTGVKPTDKREGSGAHNWGSYRDDVEDQGQNPTTPSADVSGEWTAPPAEQTETELNESGEAAAPPKEDEEPKEMTLDEWKALQDQRRMKAQFNIRRAGEGVDNNQWKKGVAYKKKNEGEDDEEESDEEDEEDHHGHRKQLVTDIRITFADNPRRGGRGGRGGRGTGRGAPRGARGGFGGSERPERPSRGPPRESAPRMDDETDFPRLVKSEA